MLKILVLRILQRSLRFFFQERYSSTDPLNADTMPATTSMPDISLHSPFGATEVLAGMI